MRVNMSIPEELVRRLDDYARANHMSRSALTCFACSQFLMAHEIRATLSAVRSAMESIAETKELTEEQAKQMEDLCRAIALMNGE